MDSFLTPLALDNATVNLDSHVGMAQNYYLYRRPSDQKWVGIVWDPSLALAPCLWQFLMLAFHRISLPLQEFAQRPAEFRVVIHNRMCAAKIWHGRSLDRASVHFPARAFAAGLPQKIKVPRLVDVTISIAPSRLRSTASTVDPTPERL